MEKEMDEDMLRELFEKHESDNGKWPKAVEKNSDGRYKLMQTASDWEAWKACALALS